MTEELLVRYVEAALERQQAGDTVDVEELCKDHPELATAVADALQLRSALPDPEHPDPLIGQKLDGRYVLESVLGAGAMGIVYQARDESLGRAVAVKVLHPGVLASPHREERFKREARVLASMDHPNVVSIFDNGRTTNGLHFIVMECLRGVSLSAVLDRAEVQIEEGAAAPDAAAVREKLGLREPVADYLPMVVAWMADIASGLVTSHAHGVFHRDLKPSNTFITDDGKPVLLDFGIAVRVGDETLTMGGTTVGTPWYMAPEQAEAKETATPAVDVYGLCATLYHLVTFRPPYVGDFVEVLRKLQSDDPPPPNKLRPDLPKDLCAILEKGLAREPHLRYADMAELERDLRAFLAFRPVGARPLGPVTRFARRVRRRPAGVIVALLLVAAVVVGMFATEWRQDALAADLARYHALRRTIPGLLSFEGYPEDRLLQDLKERDEALQLLDEILALEPDDVGTRLMRAALWFDHGKRAKAVADLAAIEAGAPSDFLRAVIARYEKHGSAASIDMSGLPAPKNAVDWFVSGFHLLRAREINTAHEHLERAGDYLPARDLRLVTSLFRAGQERTNAKRRRRLFEQTMADALKLEGHYGYRTARIAHVVGVSFGAMKNYESAAEALEEANRIRPGRHGPLQNLGIVYRRLRRYDDAVRVLTAARELRPWFFNTRYTIAQVYMDRGDFERAMELAKELPTKGNSGEAFMRVNLMGWIRTNEAIALLAGGDAAASSAAAKAAIGHFEESRRLGAPANRVKGGIAFASHLLANRKERSVLHMLATLRRDPTNPTQIANLAGILPEGELSADTVEMLGVYLKSLAQSLAPGASGLIRPSPTKNTSPPKK